MKIYRIVSLIIALSCITALVSIKGGVKGSSMMTVYAAKTPKDFVFTLRTFDAEGKVLSEGNGFYLSDGRGVASASLLRDAYRVEVTDSKGRRQVVKRIAGINTTADMVVFTLDGKKHFGPIIGNKALGEGELIQLFTYKKGKQKPLPGRVEKVEPLGDYHYYQLNIPNNVDFVGCPVVSNGGILRGVVQLNVADSMGCAYVMDASIISSLKITDKSVFDVDLNHIYIPKVLPATAEKALNYIYLMPKTDDVIYMAALSDFVQSYPERAEGKINLATFFISKGDSVNGEKWYAEALRAALNDTIFTVDKVDYTYAKALVADMTSKGRLKRAAQIVDKALAVDSLPLYVLQKAKIYYALGEDEKAEEAFNKVNNSKLASPQTLFTQAKLLLKCGGDSLKALEKMDSCIARVHEPYVQEDALYFFFRAQLFYGQKDYRKSVFDLNRYEQIVGPRFLNATFYMLRFDAEKRAHLYKQALEDVRHAATLASGDDVLECKKAEMLFLLQLQEAEACREEAEHLLKLYPNDDVLFMLKGIAHYYLKEKELAREELMKSEKLGNKQAQDLLKRYNLK